MSEPLKSNGASQVKSPRAVIVTGLSLPIQCAADDGALRGFCYVPDHRRIFRQYPIGRRSVLSHLLVAESDT